MAIPKEQRKKILLISDDIRFTSGVATISREIVSQTADSFDWVNIAGAIKHPDKGKILDLSHATNQETGVADSYVKLYPVDGYGSADLLREIMNIEKPDALVFITDPRYFSWLFQMEHEIRKKIPMVYINIWDCPMPPLYNKQYYRSCDALLAISKQTENINKVVLGEYSDEKYIRYFPHGINSRKFFPITEESSEYQNMRKFKSDLFSDKKYDFTLLFNSRNLRRKSISDTLLAFRYFLDSLPKEKADKCAIVLHTQPIDDNGTDLFAVREMLLGERQEQVIFSTTMGTVQYMNMLYNATDATILLSSNEGWGLSVTEALMAGKPVIGNVTGGIQDQARFEDEKGNWIEFDERFCSNHLGSLSKKCGKWFIPVFPSNISIQGSPVTPYIFDDRVDFRDAANAISQLYNMTQEERKERGLAGREWVLSEESMMSADVMGKNFVEAMQDILDEFVPREPYTISKIEKLPLNYLEYPVSL